METLTACPEIEYREDPGTASEVGHSHHSGREDCPAPQGETTVPADIKLSTVPAMFPTVPTFSFSFSP